MKVEKINIEKIKIDENQPRKFFDEKELDNLAKSIKKYGLLQPIILRKEDENYIVIAGERRLRAFKKLNLKEIDAIIKEVSEVEKNQEKINKEDVSYISLIENIQRENLNPLEEAIFLENLRRKENLTHENLGKLIGKTRTYVTNKLRLLNLDENIKNYIKNGTISEGHGRALLSLKDENKRNKLVDRILNENLSCRSLEKIIKKLGEEEKDKKVKCEEEYEEIINILEDRLFAKVEIKSLKNQEKGQIIINYFSKEELKDIVNRMLNF